VVDKLGKAQVGGIEQCRALYLDLLKRCLTNTIYADPNISPGASSAEFSLTLRESGRDWPAIAHTMIGLKRLNSLQECIIGALERGVPGDLVETGVWRGGASIFMRGVLKVYEERERTIWVADSFEGLPPPDPTTYPADASDTHHLYTELIVPLSEVQENFRRYGLLDNQVRFVKGWFRDTLPQLPATQFAVIRLDGDMYESTMVALQSLYPKLSPGGFAIIDDYGAIDGCRQAVDDYRDSNAIFDPMHEADWTGVYWMKSDEDQLTQPLDLTNSNGFVDEITFSEPIRTVADNVVVVKHGCSGLVRGWAADVERHRLASRVLLQVDAAAPYRADYGAARPDVAAALRDGALVHSGFSGTIFTAGLPPGRHTIDVVAVSKDGRKLPLRAAHSDFIVEALS
jgi:O-methyltransferase